MKKFIALCLLYLLPTQLFAQDRQIRDALRWEHGRKAADVVSTVGVGAALALDCWGHYTGDCLKREALKVGVALGAAELAKRLVKRERPNGYDHKSFYSMHTELACLSSVVVLCPAVGYLRIASDWHWASDVGAGAAAGLLLKWSF